MCFACAVHLTVNAAVWLCTLWMKENYLYSMAAISFWYTGSQIVFFFISLVVLNFFEKGILFLNSIIVTSKLYGTTWKYIQASAKKTHYLKMGESKYTNNYQSVDYTLHPYAWVKKKFSTICVNRLDNAATEPCVVAIWRIARMRSQCEIVKDNLQKRCLFILKS